MFGKDVHTSGTAATLSRTSSPREHGIKPRGSDSFQKNSSPFCSVRPSFFADRSGFAHWCPCASARRPHTPPSPFAAIPLVGLNRPTRAHVGDLECGAFLGTFPSITNGSDSNVRADPASLETMAQNFAEPRDTAALTRGGRAPRPVSVSTTSVSGKEDTAFVADDFPLPIDNPFQRWMRPSGFDFTPDGKATVAAMRSGDVWWVEGLKERLRPT